MNTEFATACDITAKQRAEIERLKEVNAELLGALREFLEMSDEPPERNCSCHISPPCQDCVNHSGLRRAFKVARAAIAKSKGAQS